jgi:hypothetical protein
MSRRPITFVSTRRMLVRHPWIYWLIVGVVAVTAAVSVSRHTGRLDAEREAWGQQRAVWVATVGHAPGDPIDAERREVPAAVVESATAEHVAGLVARQHIAAGEIVHEIDVAAATGPQALTPDGWLVVPIVESPSSGAVVGDRVRAVSDGVVVSDDGLVVGQYDASTLIAVPETLAPQLAAAAGTGNVTLLLVP